MTTMKKQAKATAARQGVEVVITRDPLTLTVQAPEGHHWLANGEHELVASRWDDQLAEELWRDIAERMALGIEPCSNACEWWD